MEGGLNPDIAYTLCDYYARCIEDTENVSEQSILCRTILDDYTQRVRDSRQHSEISAAIRSCCDYISTHITETLSIEFLASRAGYAEYYFSKKFKQETGTSIHAFIRREKIRRAQLLLSSTNMSILEISIELGFRSRSYFSDVFQKTTGTSPGEYRRANYKL